MRRLQHRRARPAPPFPLVRSLLLLLFLVGCVDAGNVASAAPFAVDSRPVPLDTADAQRTRVGALVWRGGIQISSTDPRFGGLSGLRVSADGRRFVAVADIGSWMTGALRYDERGFLVGIADVSLEPLRDAAGRPLSSKYKGDAESLTEAVDGGYLVGFEGQHRLVHYPRVGGAGQPITPPSDLHEAPSNGGVETMTTLADGRLLVITETWDVDGGTRGWLGPAPWKPLVWPTSEAFRPTDAATLPNGDVLVLERRFPFLAARIRRVAAAQLRPGVTLQPTEIARFEGSLTYDNMEGIAVRRGPSGETLLYLVSDDNQNFLQRTLLLMFALAPLP